MKIVFFIESLRSGGKERRMLELIHYLLSKERYQIFLILSEDDIHYDYVYEWNVTLIIMKREVRKDPRIFWQFFDFCRKNKPDIIHAWSYMNTFYAIPAKLLLKIPLISSMITRGVNNLKPWSFGMFVYKTNSIFSDLILSNSQTGLKVFKANPKKSRVIYNGIRLERFEKLETPTIIRKKYNISSRYIAVMVASFTEYKDHDLFIDVAKLISGKRDDVTFIAIGGDWRFEHIQNRINDEQVKNVSLLGPQNEVESIVAASDIGLLFSTVGEGISNAIVEYMALGKPVLATDSGGTEELVDHASTGYLVSNDNIEDICDKIIYLLDHPEERREMGNRGKQKIKENFSNEIIGNQYATLYDEIIES